MSKELLEKIRYELVTTNGLYATDLEEPVKKERFQLNHKDLIKEIDEAIIKYDEEKCECVKEKKENLYKKLKEEEKEEKYPVIVFSVEGEFRIYITPNQYLSFDKDTIASGQELINIIDLNKDRMKSVMSFNDS